MSVSDILTPASEPTEDATTPTSAIPGTVGVEGGKASYTELEIAEAYARGKLHGARRAQDTTYVTLEKAQRMRDDAVRKVCGEIRDRLKEMDGNLEGHSAATDAVDAALSGLGELVNAIEEDGPRATKGE